jgi:hypothetical protein
VTAITSSGRNEAESETGKLDGKKVVVMVAPKFVRLIEQHSDTLAGRFHCQLEHCESTRSYTTKVPPEELTVREWEIYKHLGDWLLATPEADLEHTYRQIGARRYRQQVPLAEFVWAIVLAKRNLWEFLESDAFPEGLPEVFGELHFVMMVSRFFDRAIHYAVQGYEEARAQEPHHLTNNEGRTLRAEHAG